jgi:hypothetical protein
MVVEDIGNHNRVVSSMIVDMYKAQRTYMKFSTAEEFIRGFEHV